MRVVVDSNILVRAFLQPNGLASHLLTAIVDPDHSLLLNSEILLEVARVLRYPRVVKLHTGSEGAIYDFVGWLRMVAEMITFDPLIRTPIRGESDNFVVQAALTGGAEVLCTWDRDFFEPLLWISWSVVALRF